MWTQDSSILVSTENHSLQKISWEILYQDHQADQSKKVGGTNPQCGERQKRLDCRAHIKEVRLLLAQSLRLRYLLSETISRSAYSRDTRLKGS